MSRDKPDARAWNRTEQFQLAKPSDARHESSWPEVYSWLGNTLPLLYEKVAPKLREEMDRTEAVS
jgi:hypothetical protein